MTSSQHILEVQGLSVDFAYKRQSLRALRDVSFTIPAGKTLALVGESGSGKSVTSLALMHLLAKPGRIAEGRAIFKRPNGDALDLATADEKTMRQVRGKEMAMIFQEPMTSLNPLYTIGEQIGEMLELHEPELDRDARHKRVIKMLETVEIPAAASRVDDYPHQLSGGMRQRVMIAMAMVCKPNFLIADEPTTALDVTIQAQILKLISNLQAEFAMSVLFITHDMGVVAEIADEVAVLYAGEIVEQADVYALFANPQHPYTEALLRSVLGTGNTLNNGRLQAIAGTVPPITKMPEGCKFAERCNYAVPECVNPIALREVAQGHRCRCILRGKPNE